MSSSTSSSSSNSQRTPLQERSSSDKNKLQIRIVPYSPPRLEVDSAGSHASGTEVQQQQQQHDVAHHSSHHAVSPFSKSPSYRGAGSPFSEASALPPASSPTSPTSSSARVKGKGVSGSKLASDSSGAEQSAPPTTPVLNKPSYESNTRRINASNQQEDSTSSNSSKRSMSRRENFINVHSDKTFSIVLKPTRTRTSDRSGGSSLRSPPLSNTSTVSLHERISFDAPTEDRPASPLSSVAERSVSSSTPGSPTTSTGLTEEHNAASPWNYRMVGGLRKVPKTPDNHSKGKAKEIVTSALPPLPPLPETGDTTPSPSSPSPPSPSPLEPPLPPLPSATKKPSFSSELTDSTIEETTNYKVIGRSSPGLGDSDSIDLPPSSNSSNVQLLGQSSPPQPFISSSERGFIDTPGSRNFVVHGDPSPSVLALARRPRPFPSDDSLRPSLREEYSQESLLIAPLKARKRPSSDSFGHYKQRSKESLRGRANSFSSLSSIVSQDTFTYLATPNVVRLGRTPSTSSLQQPSWAEPPTAVPPRRLMEAHQWSSQLSTVMSEFEGSDRGSRVVSVGSMPGSMPDRGSSIIGSRNSRQMRSISSSVLMEGLEPVASRSTSHSRSHSRSDSFERPSPAYMRGGRELPSPPIRTIRDHDEHGDGLADLQQLHQLQSKSSRSRLPGFLSRQSSDRSLRSSASGSLSASSIPAWARLYYGSGERRWLAAPSIRSEGGESRPGSSWAQSASPSQEQFAQNIRNPRRRAREMYPMGDRPSSMEIAPAESGQFLHVPRRKTSSLWSPHLRTDRRASRFTMWDPPSVSWSAESGMLGKRNIQIVFFVVGFGIPFAWMIAAFLPLPPRPASEMAEQNKSTTQFHSIPEDAEASPRVRPVDDFAYQSVRWWRNLNRFMSVVGLLILGAVAALAVIGVRQKWGK
ncbi:hypothetical protein F4778DRAFT_96043 [Xylariomycetidae sp. FL2044]|nr:hypothetical protein F4778DRAFT_96043 [Xylariomycetidae sp. FL2044]